VAGRAFEAQLTVDFRARRERPRLHGASVFREEEKPTRAKPSEQRVQIDARTTLPTISYIANVPKGFIVIISQTGKPQVHQAKVRVRRGPRAAARSGAAEGVLHPIEVVAGDGQLRLLDWDCAHCDRSAGGLGDG
jgi:hypothetical protein